MYNLNLGQLIQFAQDLKKCGLTEEQVNEMPIFFINSKTGYYNYCKYIQFVGNNYPNDIRLRRLIDQKNIQKDKYLVVLSN